MFLPWPPLLPADQLFHCSVLPNGLKPFAHSGEPNNEIVDQAEQRLSEIREFMKDKPDVGVLGEDLMNRFRQYLKGEGKL